MGGLLDLFGEGALLGREHGLDDQVVHPHDHLVLRDVDRLLGGELRCIDVTKIGSSSIHRSSPPS